MNRHAELQILKYSSISFHSSTNSSFYIANLDLTFNPLEDHSKICLRAFTRLKPFHIRTSLCKLKMASKDLLRTLGLTPMIGTPIIGNVDSNVSGNNDIGESTYSYHSVSDEPPSYSATHPPSSHARKPITELPISINLEAYRLPQSFLSRDHVRLTTTFPTSFENAQSLVQLVRD